VGEVDALPAIHALRAEQLRAAENLDPPRFQRFGDRFRNVRIGFFQDLLATLDHTHPGTDPRVEARQFQRNRPAAENHHGRGNVFAIEHAIAGQESRLAQAGNFVPLQARAGGDEKSARGELAHATVQQFHLNGVGVDEGGPAADEFKLPALQLLRAMVRKQADQLPLARPDRRAIRAQILRAQSKFPRVANRLRPMPAFQQGLARHATAQDAQPANLLPAFDHGRLQTQGGRGRCARVAGAATPNHNEIKIWFTHGGSLARSTS